MSTPEEKYLADLHRLQELAKKLPQVEQSYVIEVASLSREELQRRVLIGCDWMGHYHHALDGIKEIRNIPGAGMDGCRSHKEVRAIVETLVKHCPITWEDDFRGRKKEAV